MLQKLTEQRQRVWGEYKHDLENYDAATATSETRAKFDKMDEALSDLDRRLEQIKAEADRESVAAEARSAAEKVARPDVEARNDGGMTSFEKALRDPENRRVGFDLDMRGIQGPAKDFEKRAAKYEERVLSVGTFTAGGALVPTEFSPLLYKYLIENSAIRNTNVRVITTDSGDNYVQPSFSAFSAEATIVTAGSSIGPADPTFTSATLSAYKFGTLWQVQYELLQDSAYDLLSELAFQFGRALANGEGKAFLLGASGGPSGVVPNLGTVYQVVGGTPAANGPSYANLVDTMHKVIPPYRINSTWMFNDKTLAVLRKLVDTVGRPLWQPGIAGIGQYIPDTLMGKPYVIDPYMPSIGVGATSIVYGDWSGAMIREVSGLRLERSDDFAFDKDLATFRILHRADCALIDTHGALASYKGGTA
jgi:HK97 family phage major capsid protein